MQVTPGYQKSMHPLGTRKLLDTPMNGCCWLVNIVCYCKWDLTCTDLITQPEQRLILTNQQCGLVGVSVTSWYPTGALISDNQGWYSTSNQKVAPLYQKKCITHLFTCAEAQANIKFAHDNLIKYWIFEKLMRGNTRVTLHNVVLKSSGLSQLSPLDHVLFLGLLHVSSGSSGASSHTQHTRVRPRGWAIYKQSPWIHQSRDARRLADWSIVRPWGKHLVYNFPRLRSVNTRLETFLELWSFTHS